jgi:hypothetical protein
VADREQTAPGTERTVTVRTAWVIGEDGDPEVVAAAPDWWASSDPEAWQQMRARGADEWDGTADVRDLTVAVPRAAVDALFRPATVLAEPVTPVPPPTDRTA